MAQNLSPYRLIKARNIYNVFNGFNSFSFALLSGNIITLYALRLNAGATSIGILNAFLFSSFFFMPLGKQLVKKLPIIHVFASAWLARYILMIPLLFAPMAASRGRPDIALGLMLLGVFFFNASRGVGMIGNNPVLNELAVGSDRGAYMTHIQVINSAVSMFTSFALALLLGRNPPLALYAVIMGIGIISGIAGSVLLYKIPEPPAPDEAARIDFFAVSKKAFSEAPFRLFIVIFLGISFVSSVARTFIVVYTRDVYLQGDGMVAFYAIFGGMGALMMGLITRLLVDRVGAKPLYISYTVVSVLSLVPAIVAPASGLAAGVSAVLFLSFLHFSMNFGFAGAEGVAQNYFFGLIKPEEMLDLGILYYIVFGVAGAMGSFMAGLLLDGFASVGFSVLLSYRLLFSILIILLLLVLFLQRGLVRLGALPLRGALEVIFSFRDLRAISLLDRLDRSKTVREETVLLEALHSLPSRVALTELLDRARSPRLSVRIEALRAMEALPELSPEAEKALLADVQANPFTTAYIAARILGNHGVMEAVPILRNMLNSGDYMLSGEVMIALARLGCNEARMDIEQFIMRTHNPRLRIMGASALGIFGSMDSLAVLLDILKEEDPPPFVRDEMILVISSLLSVESRFYPLLIRYLDDPAMVTALALDEIDAVLERKKAFRYWNKGQKTKKRGSSPLRSVEKLRDAIHRFMTEREAAPLSRWILSDSMMQDSLASLMLAEAILEDDLVVYDRFRLLVSCWAVAQIDRLTENEAGAV